MTWHGSAERSTGGLPALRLPAPMVDWRACARPAVLVLLVACSSGGTSPPPPGPGETSAAPPDVDASALPDGPGATAEGGAPEAGPSPSDADVEGASAPECAPFGAPGQCIEVSACAALGDHTPYAGYCPGSSSIECCIVTPSTADDPPVPAGYQLMQQSQVTSAMTAWAVAILDDPTDYPMFSTATKIFGTLMVLARVEWHPPDFNNETVHRGVTLYEPV